MREFVFLSVSPMERIVLFFEKLCWRQRIIFAVGAHILGEESLNLRGELVLVPQARTGAAHGLLRDRRLRL